MEPVSLNLFCFIATLDIFSAFGIMCSDESHVEGVGIVKPIINYDPIGF